MGNFDVEKTIVVPDSGGTGNNFLAGMLASACQSKGLDANAVMAHLEMAGMILLPLL